MSAKSGLFQNNQLKCLRDFVDLQMSYFAQAHQMMADLQRELSGLVFQVVFVMNFGKVIRCSFSQLRGVVSKFIMCAYDSMNVAMFSSRYDST